MSHAYCWQDKLCFKMKKIPWYRAVKGTERLLTLGADIGEAQAGFGNNITHSFELEHFSTWQSNGRRWWQWYLYPPATVESVSLAQTQFHLAAKDFSLSLHGRARKTESGWLGFLWLCCLQDWLEKLYRWRNAIICFPFIQSYLSSALEGRQSGIPICWHKLI